MSKYAKTWWGQRFLAALEDFTDSGRLARGRSYSTDNRIKQWILRNGKVDAKLRGNINPYFGVYKEPTYQVSVQMTHLSEAQWQKIMQKQSGRSTFSAVLRAYDIP